MMLREGPGVTRGLRTRWLDLPLRIRAVALMLLGSLSLTAIVSTPLIVQWRLSQAELSAHLQTAERNEWAHALHDAASPLLAILAQLQARPEVQALGRQADRQNNNPVISGALSIPPLWPSDTQTQMVALLGPHRQLLGTSGPAMPPELLDQLAVPNTGMNAAVRVGLVVAKPDELWLAATMPVGRMRLIALGRPLHLVADLAGDSALSLFLASPGNTLMETNDQDDWPAVQALGLRPGESRSLLTQSGLMRVTATALSGLRGSQIATLTIMRSASIWDQQRRVLLLNIGAALVLFLGAMSLLVYGHVRVSLAPLADVTRVLNALASGAAPVTAPDLNLPVRRDETGKIAHAAEVFRHKAIALAQLQARAALQATQQRALIRQEMEALAETLAEPTRSEILADLRQLEATDHTVTDRTEPDALPAPETSLGLAFQKMVKRVVTQHGQLTDLLAERTNDLAIVRQALAERAELGRMRQELDIARKLQLSSLPAQFPAFPDRQDFDIHAVMQPALEVGGDFYDFMLLGDMRLGFMIGDASGKGVSAAMFVARVRTLLRSSLGNAATPAEALALANRAMATDNPAAMFATAFVAVLDLLTGRLIYACAGHDPPYLLHAGHPTQSLDGAQGIALGMLEETDYQDATIMLHAGDRLLLFTDGVTEAMAPDGSFFGQDRLLPELPALAGQEPAGLIERLCHVLAGFMETADQADDITMLALSYAGSTCVTPRG